MDRAPRPVDADRCGRCSPQDGKLRPFVQAGAGFRWLQPAPGQVQPILLRLKPIPPICLPNPGRPALQQPRMHRQQRSRAVCIPLQQDDGRWHRSTRRRLALAYTLKPGLDCWPGYHALQFATQVFLHGLPTLGCPQRQFIANFFRNTPHCDLHRHERKLLSMPAKSHVTTRGTCRMVTGLRGTLECYDGRADQGAGYTRLIGNESSDPAGGCVSRWSCGKSSRIPLRRVPCPP